LVREYKHARRIHIILDNYSIHGSQRTRRCLQQLAGRVVLHFLPPCCPDENDIERLWLDLHSNVTRNHRCRTMPQLLREVDCYLARRNQSLASFNSAGSDREAIRKSTAVLARFNQDEDVRMVIDGMMPSAADAAGLTWMNFHFAQPTVSAQQHYGGEGLPISADRATAPLPASELESRSTMPALDRVGAREGQFGRAVDFGAFELHFVKVRTAKQHVEGGAAQVW